MELIIYIVCAVLLYKLLGPVADLAGFKTTVGGGNGREDELILKQNTTYVRTFVSGSAANIIQFKASWYEHTNQINPDGQ